MNEDGTVDRLRLQADAAGRDASVLRDGALPDVKPMPPVAWSSLPGELFGALVMWFFACLAIFVATWIAYAATGHAFRGGEAAAGFLEVAYALAAVALLARIVVAAKRRTL